MNSQHIIDKATLEFLLPPKITDTSLFFGLPKIQKPDSLLRPIVSGCDGATDHLSAYITHFIETLVSKIPSHIKDTKYFLSLVKKLLSLPNNVLFVSAHVTSL